MGSAGMDQLWGALGAMETQNCSGICTIPKIADDVFKDNLATLIGVIHNDHYQWLENKSIDGVIYEKTESLLNSNIFINKQINNEIKEKIENVDIPNAALIRETKSLANVIYIEDSNH